MPSMETADLRQCAVLWPATGHDEYGQPTVGEPVEIRCRWVKKSQQVPDAQDNLVTVDATVVVCRKVEVRSNLYEGTLADYLTLGTSGDREALVEVVTFSETPDIKNRFHRRELGVRYFRLAVAETTPD